MGSDETINHERFPGQSADVGRRVVVAFGYNVQQVVRGKIVRDDTEYPHRTIIRLDDGRFVMGTECQYRLADKK